MRFLRSRTNAHIEHEMGCSARVSSAAAQTLLNTVMYPRFQRVLFGSEPCLERLDEATIGPDFDLEPIQKAVAKLLETL